MYSPFKKHPVPFPEVARARAPSGYGLDAENSITRDLWQSLGHIYRARAPRGNAVGICICTYTPFRETESLLISPRLEARTRSYNIYDVYVYVCLLGHFSRGVCAGGEGSFFFFWLFVWRVMVVSYFRAAEEEMGLLYL